MSLGLYITILFACLLLTFIVTMPLCCERSVIKACSQCGEGIVMSSVILWYPLPAYCEGIVVVVFRRVVEVDIVVSRMVVVV